MEQRKKLLLSCLPILLLGLTAFPGWRAQEKGQQPKTPPSQTKTPPAPLSPDRPRFFFGGNAAEIPATFVQGLVFLPANVNQSKPFLFTLDTGSATTSIDPSLTAAIGVTPGQRLALILPGVLLPFDSLPALARQDLASEAGRPYEGTIGADFLSRVVMDIDFARQTVRLYDPSIYKYTGKGKSFPLRIVDGLPVVRAKIVTPKGKQAEVDFGLDTTIIAGIVVSQKFSDAHRLFPTHGKIAQGYDPQLVAGESVALFRLRNFELSGWGAPDAIAELSHSKLPGMEDLKLAGIIGGDLLRRFNIVLDYPHKQIFFEANSHLKDYDEEDKSGIAVIARGPGLKTFEVVHVVPGTPAAAGGVHVGDIIAGINEEPAADMTLASVRDMFRQVGHTYKILLQRGDQTKQVSIQMRRLL